MRRLHLLLVLAALAGCKKTPPVVPVVDAGSGVDSACSTFAEAQTSSTCILTLGTSVKGFIFPAGNHDWYHIVVTDPPERALLQVTAGYAAPSSPVTLQVNLFQSDETSLGAATDQEPRGQPSPVNVVARITTAGDYYVLLQDDPSDDDGSGNQPSDQRNPYTLLATLSSDPDSNEPNDTQATATPIDITSGTGTNADGVLATTGDIDVYSIAIPANDAPPARTVLYVGIDAPAVDGGEPVTTRLSYTIGMGGDGGILAGGETPTPVGEQKISTALLVPASGTYYITVTGYRQHPDTDPPVVGDPRLKYTVTVMVMPDLDTNEPNDTVATATPVALTMGNMVSIEGRDGFIPDPDWYALNLPAASQNTRIKYQLSWDSTAANQERFPAAGAVDQGLIDDHQLTLVLPEPDPGTCQNSCPDDATNLQDGCSRNPPQCIYSQRKEDPSQNGTINNFQGEISIPAHSGAMTYAVLVEDQGNDGADDRVYKLDLTLLPETSDDLTAYHNVPSVPQAELSPALGGYNQDPGKGGAGAAQGFISYGHGDPAMDQAANAPAIPIYSFTTYDQMDNPVVTEIDYDAVNDSDVFKINLPATVSADGGAPALAWASAWSIGAAPGQDATQRGYDLQMTYFFCDPTENTGCDPVNGGWYALPVAYHSGALASWNGSTQNGFSFDASSGRFVTQANECFCVEPRFAAAKVMYMVVSGLQRASYGDAPYEVDNAFSTYPQSYTDSTGATQVCPDGADGGAATCQFCNQQFGQGCAQVTGVSLSAIEP